MKKLFVMLASFNRIGIAVFAAGLVAVSLLLYFLLPQGPEGQQPSRELTRFEDGSIGVTLLLNVDVGRSAQPRSWELRFPAEFEPAVSYSVKTITFNGTALAKDEQFLRITFSLPDLKPIKGPLSPGQENEQESAVGKVFVRLNNAQQLGNYNLTREIKTGVCKLSEPNAEGLNEVLPGITPEETPWDTCSQVVDDNVKKYALMHNDQSKAIVTKLKHSEVWHTELGGWFLSWTRLTTESSVGSDIAGSDINNKLLEILEKFTVRRIDVSQADQN